MVFVDWHVKEGMEEEELSKAREDFAVVEKDWDEAKVKAAKGKSEEINVHVPEIKADH